MASSFACYFPAEEPVFFSIEIKSNAWVSDILKAIRSELRDPYRLDLRLEDLRLFQVSTLHPSQANTHPIHCRRMLHWNLEKTDNFVLVDGSTSSDRIVISIQGRTYRPYSPMALARPTTRSILSLLIQRVYFTMFFTRILTPDILAVLQYLDTVNDPDDEYNKRVRKGTYRADISIFVILISASQISMSVLIVWILTFLPRISWSLLPS